MWQFWLIIAGVFFIGEIITIGFLLFWCAIGAILAMITSLFTSNIIIQGSVFVISSGLLIFLTKPFADKFTNHDTSINTNAYSIIGQTGIVTKEINSLDGTGQIKVGTEIWSAKCNTDVKVPVGTEIEVESIDGVKAIVSIKELAKI